MRRKYSLLTGGLILFALAVLQGCAFQLRGAADLPPFISPLYVQGLGEFDPLRRDLRQLFADAGIQVTDDRAAAAAILRLHNQRLDRRVLSVDAQGKVVEYELYSALDFDLQDNGGALLVAGQSVGVQRTYVNTETRVLGKQQEEALLRRDMRGDLAGRILSRLQARLR